MGRGPLFVLSALSGLALLGCVAEADWAGAPVTDSPAPSGTTDPRSHLSSFQGLSSGLPSDMLPSAIAHLDGTVYLVVDGQLFSLASAATAWTTVGLPLG